MRKLHAFSFTDLHFYRLNIFFCIVQTGFVIFRLLFGLGMYRLCSGVFLILVTGKLDFPLLDQNHCVVGIKSFNLYLVELVHVVGVMTKTTQGHLKKNPGLFLTQRWVKEGRQLSGKLTLKMTQQYVKTIQHRFIFEPVLRFVICPFLIQI